MEDDLITTKEVGDYRIKVYWETKKKLLQAIKGVNVEEEDVSLYTTGGWD